MEKVVERYISALIKAQVITDEDREIYKYHIICALESVLVIMTMTIVGVFFHEVFNVWAFIICFFLIRNRAGGFHFNSFWKCYLGSVGLEFLGIYLVKQLNDNTCVFECISIGMMVIILWIGAINHVNMHYDDREYKAIKRKSRIVTMGIGIIIFFLRAIYVPLEMILYMEYAVILSGIMLVLGIIAGQHTVGRRKF